MKRYFCENCGSQLNVDDQFCENCGHPVPAGINENSKNSTIYSKGSLHEFNNLNRKDPLVQSSKNDEEEIFFFSHDGWESSWNDAAKKYGNDNLGIIVTNMVGSDDDNVRLKYDNLVHTLTKYIAFRRQNGVYYFVLDMATQTVLIPQGYAVSSKSVVSVLKEIYRVAKPKYLLIVGNEESIGAVKWESETYVAPGADVNRGDSDRFVDSDLPYLTLDFESPWSGQQWQDYSFEQCVRVGRVPSRALSAYGEAITYFENVINLDREKRALDSFGLSAQFWEATTKIVYQPFGKELLTSPNILEKDFLVDGIQKLNGGREPNLLYFALHGSDQTHYWYGENNERNYFPEVFSPNCLPSVGGYVIGSEACYGAKPNDCGSILSSALKQGCLAFLGSSQIAYSGRWGGCGCADFMVGEWLKKVADGYTFGDAYIAALKQLCRSELKPEVIKTLAEYSLYGDPSLSLVAAKSSAMNFFRRNSLPLQNGIHIPMPDVRKAVSLRLTKVTEAIEAKLNRYIENYQKDFVGTTPYFFEVKGCNSYQAVYTKDLGLFSKIMKVYFDKNGNIGDVYFSN